MDTIVVIFGAVVEFLYKFIGHTASIFFFIIVILNPVFKFMRKGLESVAATVTDMPKMVPIPIPSYSQSNFFKKILIWIFSVRKWKLTEQWHFQYKKENEVFVIPEGYIFDGGSVPRFLWALLSPVGMILIQSLIHDYGYDYAQLWCVDKTNGKIIPYKKGSSKDIWDDLFREIGNQVNGVRWINFLAFQAVRAFGRMSKPKIPAQPVSNYSSPNTGNPDGPGGASPASVPGGDDSEMQDDDD